MNFNKVTFQKLQSELHVWLTLQELTTLIGVSARTVDKLCSSGALPYSKIGHKRIFLNADVRALISKEYNGSRCPQEQQGQQQSQQESQQEKGGAQ